MGIFKIATVVPSAKHLTFPPTATFFQVARVGPQMRRWRQRLGSESGQLGSCWAKAKDLSDGFGHGRRLANVRRFFWCLLKGAVLFFLGFLVKQNRRRGWDISISLKTFKCVQQRIIKFVVGRSWAEVSWAAAYDSLEFQTPGATLVAGLKEHVESDDWSVWRLTNFERAVRGSLARALYRSNSILCF